MFRGGIGVFARKLVAHNRLGTRIGILGDAKVDHHSLCRVIVPQEDVVRRQIAVDDAAVMRLFQAFTHTFAEDQQILRRHRPFFELLVQARPVDVIHQQVDEAFGSSVVLGITHDCVVPHLADLFLTGHQDEVVVVAEELGFENFNRHQPARNLTAGTVDI